MGSYRDSEIQRARYAREAGQRQGWSDKQIISYYSIDRSVIPEVFGEVSLALEERRKRRVDYRKLILDWCKEHVYEEVTIQQVAEVGCVSAATARKFVEDRGDVFKRLGRGRWEVRDAEADRRFARQRAT